MTTSWQRLISGQSGIRQQQLFAFAPQPIALIDRQPAQLTPLIQTVVKAALEDAGLVPPLLECGVVVGSSRSYQASWEQLSRGMHGKDTPPSPVYWLDTLPHMSAIATARQVGANGPVLAPMAACATGIWAIAQGFELIQTRQCQRVIVGAVEAPITPLTVTGFQQMRALAATGAYPFDCRREGFVLGEGAAILVLESAQLASRRSAPVYGQVLGFGLTSDAYHQIALEPKGGSAIAAVKQCLDRSNLRTTDIDYIHAHGTATRLNDSHEAQLIRHLFPQGVAVSSTKGATGHTLGASGAIGVAFCLMALKHQLLPPCVGLQEPEFDLDLVTAPQSAQIGSILCFSFGFGGQNAVVALFREKTDA